MTSGAAASVVRCEGLAFRYDGRQVLGGLSMEVPPGAFWAVLGPNGAGKTTLLRLLLGLILPSSGSLEVAGRVPRRGNQDVGYVPQRRTLDPDLPARGRDLVGLGIDGHRWGVPLPDAGREQRIDAALAAVDAQDLALRPVGRLSGGEQQRLVLAQALVGNPRLLLLDEPLASLDLRHQGEVVRLVDRVRKKTGVTVMLVAHDINPLLHHVDSVLYLAGGRGVAGPPQDVIRGDVLTSLYGTPVEVFAARGRLFVAATEGEP